MKNENTQQASHTPKIDFIINQDTKVRFILVENNEGKEEYRGCVYHKGVFDGVIQGKRVSQLLLPKNYTFPKPI